MIIRRKVDKIAYCTECQSFFGSSEKLKYPLVLNWLITNKCNFNCRYCFAVDIENKDLISDDIIDYINMAQYLKLVISGGEPFQNENIWAALTRIDSKNKAIVIDTNGTYDFNSKEVRLLKQKRVTLRISLDSVSPAENERIRKCSKGMYYEKVISNIELLSRKHHVDVALQTVVTKLNIKSLKNLATMIRHWGITKWYLQPIVASGKGALLHSLIPKKDSILYEAANLGLNEDILLIKEDENDKSVLLLNNYGDLVTEKMNKNIFVGNIMSIDETKLLSKLNKDNHIKRYKIYDKCLCAQSN